jgi:hypothetical protein
VRRRPLSKHHVIDYDTFLPRLVSGLRQAWDEVRRRRRGETFYMFGIATDSDVVVLERNGIRYCC